MVLHNCLFNDFSLLVTRLPQRMKSYAANNNKTKNFKSHDDSSDNIFFKDL